MRSALSFASGCVIVLLSTACSSVNESAQDPGNTFCFGCHSETSALGKKILWAQAGWETSVHAEGQVARIYDLLPAEGVCPSFIQTTSATCTSNGGKFSSTGKICTMPRGTTPAACVAAGGTFAPAVPDQVFANACPPFAQAVSSGKTACALVFGHPERLRVGRRPVGRASLPPGRRGARGLELVLRDLGRLPDVPHARGLPEADRG